MMCRTAVLSLCLLTLALVPLGCKPTDGTHSSSGKTGSTSVSTPASEPKPDPR